MEATQRDPTIEAKNINDFLASQEKIPNTEKPMFRLKWSNDDYEWRKLDNGEFKFVRKYPFINNRWMFQQFMPPDIVKALELPESNQGYYETLYVFEDKWQKALPLNQQVIEFLLYHIRRPQSSLAIKTAIAEEMQLSDEIADKYFDNEFETSSPVVSLLHSKEAIVVPKNLEIQ